MTHALRHAVLRYAEAHADAHAQGLAATPLQGGGTMRAHAPTGMIHTIYKPLVCMILQRPSRWRSGGTPTTSPPGSRR